MCAHVCMQTHLATKITNFCRFWLQIRSLVEGYWVHMELQMPKVHYEFPSL